MQNRNAKPSIQLPSRCPRCGAKVWPDTWKVGERFQHGGICHTCGWTTDNMEVKKC